MMQPSSGNLTGPDFVWKLEFANERKPKRQGTAALQNLAEGVARNASRQRHGVRLSSAAFRRSPPHTPPRSLARAALFRGPSPC